MEAVCMWAAYDGDVPLDIWEDKDEADDCCEYFELAPAVEVAVLPWAEYEAMQSQLVAAQARIAELETAPMGYCGRPGNPDAVLLPLADDRNWTAKGG